MTTLNDILIAHDAAKYATDAGKKMHTRLQRVVLGNELRGDQELIAQIHATPGLAEFFGTNSKTEVPIAGTINGRFISRRLDRLVIDGAAKTVSVLDYKTDINHRMYYEKYIAQLREYVSLLRAIYPGYKISGYILWTHDFLLEKVTE